jgi:hypothetical protein
LGLLAESSALYRSAGDVELAIELAALAQNHLKANMITRERAKKFIEKIAAKLPPDKLRNAEARGRERNVQATSEEMLVLLEGGDAQNDINI